MSEAKDLTKTLVCIVGSFFIFVILYNAYLYLAKRVVMVEEPVLLVREGFDAAAFKEASGSEVNQGVRGKSQYISDQKTKAKKKAEDDKKKGITTPAEKDALAKSGPSSSSSGGGSGGGAGSSGGANSGGGASSISGASSSGGASSGGGAGGGASSGGGAGAGAGAGMGTGSGEGFQGNQNCLSIAECQTMQTANDNSKLLTKLTQKVDLLSQNVSNMQAAQVNNAKNKGVNAGKKASASIPNSGLTSGVKMQSQNSISKNS